MNEPEFVASAENYIVDLLKLVNEHKTVIVRALSEREKQLCDELADDAADDTSPEWQRKYEEWLNVCNVLNGLRGQ